jgi:hypothetical protein
LPETREGHIAIVPFSNNERIAAMLTKKVPSKKKKKKPEVVVIHARIIPIEKVLPLLIIKAVRLTSNSWGACTSATLPKYVVRATKREGERFTLDRLLQTGMSRVVITTPLTERFSTTPVAAI